LIESIKDENGLSMLVETDIYELRAPNKANTTIPIKKKNPPVVIEVDKKVLENKTPMPKKIT
jgi:hypothetical protein